jgi:hypothetical protein
MKHVTRWSPDTCGCVIDLEWDDAVPAEQRSHTTQNIISRCPSHQETHFADKHDHYDTILKENQLKNKTHGHFMEEFPHLTEEIEPDITEGHLLVPDINASSQPVEKPKRLKKNIKYIYAWTGEGKNRTLQVKFQGADLKDNHKKQLKDVIVSKVGTDKVIVI